MIYGGLEIVDFFIGMSSFDMSFFCCCRFIMVILFFFEFYGVKLYLQVVFLELLDKVQMVVIVMCFSDYGDYLLVGYVGGIIFFWDVLRVKLNMFIVD